MNNTDNVSKKDLIAVILDSYQASSQESQERFRVFVFEFFEHMAPYDLRTYPSQVWSQIVTRTWLFIEENHLKSCEKGYLKISQKSFENPGNKLIHRTTIEVLNCNRPFLVGSLIGFLRQKGLTPRLLVHPVFWVERDLEGQMVALRAPHIDRSPEAMFQEESFIYCELEEHLDAQAIEELEPQMSRVFEDVYWSVFDWKAMRVQLHKAIDGLEQCPFSLEDTHRHELEEIIAFLRWLDQGHFTYLGYCYYQLTHDQGGAEFVTPLGGLGILRSQERQSLDIIFEGIELTARNRRILLTSDPLLITKTSQLSTVHRLEAMNCVGIKHFDAQRRVIGIHHFLGLMTSGAYVQSTRDIPLLRQKITSVLSKMNLAPTWYDGKALVNVLETVPRDELFQSSIDELADLGKLVLQIYDKTRLFFFIRTDQFGRYLSCFVYVPKDRYQQELEEKICDFLGEELGGDAVLSQVHLGSFDFAHLHYTIHPKKGNQLAHYDRAVLDHKLNELSWTWYDQFIKILEARSPDQERETCVFPQEYQEHFSPQEAVDDLAHLQKAVRDQSMQMWLQLDQEMRNLAGQSTKLNIKIYNPEQSLPLSLTLQILDRMGLSVLQERHYSITLGQKTCWMHTIEAHSKYPLLCKTFSSAEKMRDTFHQVWTEKVENDAFNALVLFADLTWRECMVLRSYFKYLKQLNTPFSQSYIEEVFIRHSLLTRNLLSLFEIRLSPMKNSGREKEEKALYEDLKRSIDVLEGDEGRVLRSFLMLIHATVRTTFYQVQRNRPYLAFKFECARIDTMPFPKPLYEIFVYGTRFEAVHLRGGKVARGGIRWSDRREDFRTEILDLMKTQMVKNAVIVPVGSKGGFVIKNTLFASPQEEREEGFACYELFMSALLDLTDNLVDNEVIHPPETVIRDEPDPYLVVAADKGTATLSDAANAVSRSYHYWLDDAFASGGSTGYDHKKIGITARGAWKSVEHHLRELKINLDQTPITVVGVGDMSGDVFGNGMLLSNQIKLVGAFNHRHIFIDPQPDPQTSYEARQFLFERPSSTWMDYPQEALSKGGGIFERRAASLDLSAEAAAFLGLTRTTTPDLLVRTLLKMRVDLLWMGGIGTFVRARDESHSDVGDKTNDAIRVTGHEIRARIVGEGANLGFTQKGRIEYALQGGRINTDAIDNSAGVDCSDHEVNIKILFQPLVQSGDVSESERNKLMQDVEEEVATLVLKDNYWQNQAIGLAVSQAPKLLEEHARLIRHFEQSGLLNRTIECLPDDEEFQRRQSLQLGLTRPELCVLLSYSKIALYHQLLGSKLLEDPYFERILLRYFPKNLAALYRDTCLQHPLKKEIIATSIINVIINTLGPNLIYEISLLTGHKEADVIKVIWVVRKVLQLVDIEEMFQKIFFLPTAFQQEVLGDIDAAVRFFVIYLLKDIDLSAPILQLAEQYHSGFELIRTQFKALLPSPYLHDLKRQQKKLCGGGLNRLFSDQLILLEPLRGMPDLVSLSSAFPDHTQEQIAKIYYALEEIFSVRWVFRILNTIALETVWQKIAAQKVRDDWRLMLRRLTAFVLKRLEPHRELSPSFWKKWRKESAHNPSHVRYHQVLDEMTKGAMHDVSPLVVLFHEFKTLTESEEQKSFMS